MRKKCEKFISRSAQTKKVREMVFILNETALARICKRRRPARRTDCSQTGKIINFIAILFYFPFQRQHEKTAKHLCCACFSPEQKLLLLTMHFSNEPAGAPNAFDESLHSHFIFGLRAAFAIISLERRAALVSSCLRRHKYEHFVSFMHFLL